MVHETRDFCHSMLWYQLACCCSHGFPLVVRRSDLLKFCPFLFGREDSTRPRSVQAVLDRLLHKEDFLVGTEIVFLRSSAYNQLHASELASAREAAQREALRGNFRSSGSIPEAVPQTSFSVESPVSGVSMKDVFRPTSSRPAAHSAGLAACSEEWLLEEDLALPPGSNSLQLSAKTVNSARLKQVSKIRPGTSLAAQTPRKSAVRAADGVVSRKDGKHAASPLQSSHSSLRKASRRLEGGNLSFSNTASLRSDEDVTSGRAAAATVSENSAALCEEPREESLAAASENSPSEGGTWVPPRKGRLAQSRLSSGEASNLSSQSARIDATESSQSEAALEWSYSKQEAVKEAVGKSTKKSTQDEQTKTTRTPVVDSATGDHASASECVLPRENNASSCPALRGPPATNTSPAFDQLGQLATVEVLRANSEEGLFIKRGVASSAPESQPLAESEERRGGDASREEESAADLTVKVNTQQVFSVRLHNPRFKEVRLNVRTGEAWAGEGFVGRDASTPKTEAKEKSHGDEQRIVSLSKKSDLQSSPSPSSEGVEQQHQLKPSLQGARRSQPTKDAQEKECEAAPEEMLFGG